MRLNIARVVRAGGAGCSLLRQPAVQRLERLVLTLEPHRKLADEVAEGAAVALQRGDRDPLVRPVGAAADRGELDGGDPRPPKTGRGRGGRPGHPPPPPPRRTGGR